MLYRKKGCKNWMVSFRDPNRPGKFIRKSTGTDSKADARSIEQAMHLALKRQMNEQRLRSIVSAVFEPDPATLGLPLCNIWALYERYIRRRDRVPQEQLIKQRKSNLDAFITWCKETYGLVDPKAEDINFDCAMAYSDHLKRKTKLKDKSRKEYIGNLSAIWNAAGALHKMDNPWKDVRPVVRDGKTEEIRLALESTSSSHSSPAARS